MLRATWYAQELLSTFGEDLSEVTLAPSSGGRFEIRVDDLTVWSRTEDGGFPAIGELKRRVRDATDPGRDLGHLDR